MVKSQVANKKLWGDRLGGGTLVGVNQRQGKFRSPLKRSQTIPSPLRGWNSVARCVRLCITGQSEPTPTVASCRREIEIPPRGPPTRVGDPRSERCCGDRGMRNLNLTIDTLATLASHCPNRVTLDWRVQLKTYFVRGQFAAFDGKKLQHRGDQIRPLGTMCARAILDESLALASVSRARSGCWMKALSDELL